MNSLARDGGFVAAIEARTPTMRFYLAIFIVVIFAIESHAATGEKSSPTGVESLGGRLLDDLSPDAAQPAPAAQPAAKPQAMKEIEDSLKASTPLHGFGAGASPVSQSLARVQNSMRQAQSLLTQPGAGGKPGDAQLASPVQHQIIS